MFKSGVNLKCVGLTGAWREVLTAAVEGLAVARTLDADVGGAE